MATVYLRIEVSHLAGPFASGEALAESLIEQLSDLEVDEAQYSFDSAEAYTPPKQSVTCETYGCKVLLDKRTARFTRSRIAIRRSEGVFT